MKCELCGFERPCPVCKDDNGTLPPVSETQKYELWIDVYQGNEGDDWQVLKDNGVAGVCAKIGYGWDAFRGASGSTIDSKFVKHITEARSAGLKVAGYWWSDPLESWGRQVETCVQACKDLNLDWIAVDMELGEGWQSVWDKRKQKYIWAKRTIAGNQIAACNKYLLDNIKERLGIPVILYTRSGFVNEYAPQVKAWANEYPLWVSSMPYEKVITCNRLEAIAKGYTYCATWQEWREKYAIYPDGKFKPLAPGKDWTIWQFSMDHVKLPGAGSYMDLNWMRA